MALALPIPERSMSKVYSYEFADGEVVFVPLSDEWDQQLRELDRQEENNNQTQRRRHCSLEAYSRYGGRLLSSHDALEAVEARDAWEQMRACLTRQEAAAVELYFWWGYRQRELAIRLGLSRGRVAQLLRSAQSKMRAAFYNH